MKQLLLHISLLTALLLPSCGGGNAANDHEGKAVELRHAENLTMSEQEDGVTLVTLRNPWDTTRTLARYALVERGRDMPGNLPEGTVRIDVPLERSVVYSGMHAALINELGAGKAVAGICDADYVYDPAIKQGIADGRIADCGRNTQPNIEKIASLRPSAIILSPYEKRDEASRFARTGLKVIQAAEYMESTPLGRAEWMRFFGRLYGEGHRADSLFNVVEQEYDKAKRLAANSGTRPSVLFDRPYGGVWSVPTSGSVTGHLITDAGGMNPFGALNEAGSAQLAPEEVLHTARNADIWLIRHFEPSLTRASLENENALYTKFKAFAKGDIYGADTLERPLFEDGAFHPDRVLKEMVILFHPELSHSDTLRYYKKL